MADIFSSLWDTGAGLFDSAVSGIESLFGSAPAAPTDFGSFDFSQFAPTSLLSGQGASTVPAIYQNAMASAPMVMGGITGLAAYGIRGLAAKFPQLAARLNATGLTRSAAYTQLKRFGPAALIALGFGATEISQLAVAGSGRRRMNICNGRALRRASRRVSAFHNFYKRTCGLPVARHRRKCK